MGINVISACFSSNDSILRRVHTVNAINFASDAVIGVRNSTINSAIRGGNTVISGLYLRIGIGLIGSDGLGVALN